MYGAVSNDNKNFEYSEQRLQNLKQNKSFIVIWIVTNYEYSLTKAYIRVRRYSTTLTWQCDIILQINFQHCFLSHFDWKKISSQYHFGTHSHYGNVQISIQYN